LSAAGISKHEAGAAEAAPSLREALDRFRASHAPKRVSVGRRLWTYSKSGRGPAVLLLSGALGQADFGFAVIERLERGFTIIAPDYPPVAGLDELVEGLAAILDAEGVGAAHVVGGSFGGIAAQSFGRERPARVASLSLSHTGPPLRTRGLGAARALAGLLPESWLKSLFRKRVRHALASADPFWAEQFDASVERLGKADFLSRMRLAGEFGERYGREQRPLRPPYPVMILSAPDDPLIAQRATKRLVALYPDAADRGFEGTGHVAAIVEPDAFADVLAGFMRGVTP
jgi:pimeloyl-ACP methyl ester carboxylesterase